eukprot:7020-Heterococcus_DN1.PRE.2
MGGIRRRRPRALEDDRSGVYVPAYPASMPPLLVRSTSADKAKRCKGESDDKQLSSKTLKQMLGRHRLSKPDALDAVIQRAPISAVQLNKQQQSVASIHSRRQPPGDDDTEQVWPILYDVRPEGERVELRHPLSIHALPTFSARELQALAQACTAQYLDTAAARAIATVLQRFNAAKVHTALAVLLFGCSDGQSNIVRASASKVLSAAVKSGTVCIAALPQVVALDAATSALSAGVLKGVFTPAEVAAMIMRAAATAASVKHSSNSTEAVNNNTVLVQASSDNVSTRALIIAATAQFRLHCATLALCRHANELALHLEQQQQQQALQLQQQQQAQQLPPLKLSKLSAHDQQQHAQHHILDVRPRSTPRILRPGYTGDASIRALKEELLLAQRSASDNQEAVKRKVGQWVHEVHKRRRSSGSTCSTSSSSSSSCCDSSTISLSPQQARVNKGLKRLNFVLGSVLQRRVTDGFSRWQRFTRYGTARVTARAFLHAVGAHALVASCLVPLQRRCLARKLTRWRTVLQAQRLLEVTAAAVELQRAVRGFLGRRRFHRLKYGAVALVIQRWISVIIEQNMDAESSDREHALTVLNVQYIVLWCCSAVVLYCFSRHQSM